MRPSSRFHARCLIAVLALAVAALALAACMPITPEAGGTVPAPAAAARLQEPKAVFDAFHDALNAHDLDAALAFFADDAVARTPPPQPPPNVYTGKDELRSWLERNVNQNIRIEVSDVQTVGDTVSATGATQVDSLPPGFVVRGTVEITVVDGKITSFTYTLDDDTIERLGALEPAPGGTVPAPAAAAAGLQSGDTVGEMVLTQGPVPFDLNIPPLGAFCNANPMLEAGSTVANPGEYAVQCTVPALPQMGIGFGWVTPDENALNDQWPAIGTELYVNGQLVDQEAFGSLDAEVPVAALPGQDPSEVVNLRLRAWNVVLENLTPGQLELRYVWNITRDLSDEMTTTPQGVYDITYHITVDESMAAAEGPPEPVEIVQQSPAVFDAFHAAVNAHDLEAALALFAAHAVAQFPNQPPPNVYTGRDEIRTWLEGDFDDNIYVEVEDVQTAGDTVTATSTVQVDSLPPDFVLRGTVEITVVDGKITSFTFTLDDDTIERLGALEAQ
jgi:ketosteroid isomerase-like protein